MKFNSDRTFGVEFEVNFRGRRPSKGEIADALRDAGLSAVTDWGDTYDVWRVKHDCSIGYGWEVVSPILKGYEGLREVATALKVLESFGAQCSRRCGLHVHHGCPDFNIREVANLARTIKAVSGRLSGFVSPIRNRRWCRQNPIRSFDEIDQIEACGDLWRAFGYTDKYQAFNVAGLRHGSRGTVEVRLHEGTADLADSVAWIVLTQAIIERAKGRKIGKSYDMVRGFRTTKRLITLLGAPQDVLTEWAVEYMDAKGKALRGSVEAGAVRETLRAVCPVI